MPSASMCLADELLRVFEVLDSRSDGSGEVRAFSEEKLNKNGTGSPIKCDEHRFLFI